MSPEANTFLKQFVESLGNKGGKSTDELDNLRNQARVALESGDFGTVARIAVELETATNFKSGLKKDLEIVAENFRAVLQRYGLVDTNIELDFPVTPQALPAEPAKIFTTAPKVDETESGRRDRRRDDGKYVDNAPAKIALELIAKDAKGFVHTNVSSVSLNILKPDRRTEKDINDAHHRYETTTSQLGVSFARIAKETKSKTMAELIDQILVKKVAKKVNDPDWKKFYENCKSSFGKMSPQDFIENVLQRFYSKEEKTLAAAKQKEAQKEKKARKTVSEISPSKIDPVYEILLCNRLLSDHVISKLENELFGGKKLSEILKEKGVIKENLKSELETSREAMGHKRKNAQITPQDFETTANFVLDTLRHMEKSLRGWHTIDKKLIGFRTLLSLAQEIQNTENMSTKVWTILYSSKQYQLDREGFPEIALPGTN